MAACTPIGDDAKLGIYEQYGPQLKGCAAPQYMGKPRFFGKNATNDTPLYVAIDFEHYQIARTGMAIATSAAVILGISLCVVLMKKKKGM